MVAAPTPLNKRSRSPGPSRPDGSPSSKRSRALAPSRNQTSPMDPSAGDEHHILDEVFASNGGDIYLRVNRTVFCVHLVDTLQKVEGLFGDLFSIQQPEGAEHRIFGLPFCDIPNCTPDELRYLLQYIYGEKNLIRKTFPKNRVGFNLEALLAILKLSARYDMPKLRLEMIRHLDEYFTCIFRHIKLSELQPYVPIIFGHRIPKDHFLRLYPLQMINTLNECGVVLYLPMACYFAAQLSLEDIVSGVKRSDGSKETLSDADKLVVLRGKERLLLLRRNVTFAWLMNHTKNGPEGQSENRCNGGRRKYRTTCYEFIQDMYEEFNGPDSDFLSTRSDALSTLSPLALDVLDENLCRACSDLFMSRISIGLSDSLNDLPRIFCSSSWFELMVQQRKLESEWSDEPLP